jgi:hypothetical protein
MEAFMHDATVIPLRRRPAPGYSDTDAVNDIHALITRAEPGDGALGDIAVILSRAGRPVVAGRDVEISATETALGWPVACAQAGDASVFIRQAPAGSGLLVEVVTKTAAEHDALTITLDGATLHPARPGGGAA